MKITKLGHCCLLIKEKNLTILTDPGAFTTEQNTVTGIDVVLITHEHKDHLHIESLKRVVENNPQVKVITNASVGKLLDVEHILYTQVSHNQEIIIEDVLFQGIGEVHADIYKEIKPVENTGYFINKKLFYPGDALTNPGQSVDILALPVVGPWIKTSEVIEYGLSIKPAKAFPVHDGLLNHLGAPFIVQPKKFLEEAGIQFIIPELGKEIEF